MTFFMNLNVLKKVITTETFNVDFHNKFIKFWIILFFQLFFILWDLFPNLLPYTYIYIHTYISSSSSSSCRAASTDIPDPLLPLLPIIHRLWQVFRATSRILT